MCTHFAVIKAFGTASVCMVYCVYYVVTFIIFVVRLLIGIVICYIRNVARLTLP